MTIALQHVIPFKDDLEEIKETEAIMMIIDYIYELKNIFQDQ